MFDRPRPRFFDLRRLRALLLAGMLVAPGCAARVPVDYGAEPSKPRREVALMGHAIQVGAFSNVENAIRLTDSLEARGLDAYYFLHKEGLYRVRFGNFSTMEEARQRAERLQAEGIIEAFYIVRPEDYTAAKAPMDGDFLLRSEIVSTAKSFIGLPYRWGGTDPTGGLDCSGLTTAVYQLNGLNLPRTSAEQFRAGRPVARGGLKEGDLVFFAFAGGRRVSHVGVYTGDGRFIHAPGRGKLVRADLLSESTYQARYLGGRTYL